MMRHQEVQEQEHRDYQMLMNAVKYQDYYVMKF